MILVLDARLDYPGYFRGPSRCRLRLWRGAAPAPVVIVSELDDNPGTSVTNQAEVIATLAAELLRLRGPETTWIEHYPARPGYRGPDLLLGEHYDAVTFEWRAGVASCPRWGRLARGYIEALIGQTLTNGDIR